MKFTAAYHLNYVLYIESRLHVVSNAKTIIPKIFINYFDLY